MTIYYMEQRIRKNPKERQNMERKMINAITFICLTSFCFLIGCNETSKDTISENTRDSLPYSENDEEPSGEEEVYDDSNNYYQGDSFSLYKIEGEDKGAELHYYVKTTGILTSNSNDEYMFVEVDVTNKSDREQIIETPDFYADDYLITYENPIIPEDATPPFTSIKPGKKISAKFYQYIDHPYEYKKLEANFGNASVIIVGGELEFKNNNGETFYENGKQTGDPYGICGCFIGKEYYGDSLNGKFLTVKYVSPDIYHVVIKMEDGSTVEGDADYQIYDGQAGLHLRKDKLYSLFYYADSNKYNVFCGRATWRFDKATEEEYNMAQSNVPSSENDEIVDTIMLYYANLHGNNNIKSEIVSDSSDSLYIRILDYDDRELGIYEYNKNTDSWTDLETKDPVDFDEAAENYEEDFRGRSGYPDYIIPYSSDRPLTESDLSGLSAQELTYARNEIFARHGYIFKSAELNNYFNSKDWYYPDSSFNGKLSDLEQKNANFISNYQDEYGLTYKPE